MEIEKLKQKLNEQKNKIGLVGTSLEVTGYYQNKGKEAKK